MQVLIVYESMFGNTHQVADAVAAGVREAAAGADTMCVPVAEATAERVASADLLVVGGPTHARGMSIARSRNDAVQSPETYARKDAAATQQRVPVVDPDAEGPGLRTWFHGIPKAAHGRQAAAFDTRLRNPMAGGAARGIARRLRRCGYTVVVPPEGFIVDDAAGPLHDGELERARAWGASLVPTGILAS